MNEGAVVMEVVAERRSSQEGVKDKTVKSAALTPAKYCNLLTSASSTQLDVEVIKKLRLMLRNESARYVGIKRVRLVMIYLLIALLQLDRRFRLEGRIQRPVDSFE